jgi:hypothetical protein
MFKRSVIPNEVKDLTNGDGSRNQICVSRASNEESFVPLRMTRGVL